MLERRRRGSVAGLKSEGLLLGRDREKKEREVKVRVREARVRKQVSHLLRYFSDDHHFSGVLSFGGAKVQSGNKGRVGRLGFQPETRSGLRSWFGFSPTLRLPPSSSSFLPPVPLAAFSLHRSSTSPRGCWRTTPHTHAPSRQAQAVARRPTTPARRRPAQCPTASSSPCPSSNSSSCVLLSLSLKRFLGSVKVQRSDVPLLALSCVLLYQITLSFAGVLVVGAIAAITTIFDLRV